MVLGTQAHHSWIPSPPHSVDPGYVLGDWIFLSCGGAVSIFFLLLAFSPAQDSLLLWSHAIRPFPLMWVCVSVCIPSRSDHTWGWMALIQKQIPCAEWSPALGDSNFLFTLAFCPWVSWAYPCSSLVFSFTVVQRCIAQETAETCTQPIGSPGYQIPGKGVVVGSRSTLWPSSLGGHAPMIF